MVYDIIYTNSYFQNQINYILVRSAVIHVLFMYLYH